MLTDSQLLDALRAVRWPARRPVRGGAPGVHAARSRGTSVELSEYRAYRQGDDPRRLDWKLLARSDRAFVRLSPDHAVLTTMLLVDATASMAFPVDSLGKWRQARQLALGLAAVSHGQGDPVGLAVASEGNAPMVPPRTRRGVVAELARVLGEVRPRGSASLARLAAASTAGRLVVLSDLLGEADALRAECGRRIAAGAEVHMLHVVARAELEPPTDALLAVDPEDDAVRRPLTPATRDAYVQAFAEWRTAEARRWRELGAVHTLVGDDEPADHAVRRVIAARGGDDSPPGAPARDAGARR